MFLMNCSQGLLLYFLPLLVSLLFLALADAYRKLTAFSFFIGLWLCTKSEDPWELVQRVGVGCMGDVRFPLSTVSGNFIL